jgi:hypothetical protein
MAAPDTDGVRTLAPYGKHVCTQPPPPADLAGVVCRTRTLTGLSAPPSSERGAEREEPQAPSEEEAGLGQQNTDGDPVPLEPVPR